LKNKHYHNILIAIALIVLSGCEYINLKQFTEEEEEEERVVVATVGNSTLYLDDLKGIVNKDASSADSANLMNRYVNSWVRKQLLISEASEQINFDLPSIDRKVLDYRYALMVHEYKKFYVDQHLDTAISSKEIQNYYEENKDNFELKQNIIRGYFIKITKDAPKLNRLEKLVNSKKKDDFTELKSYCFRFADTYFLEDSIWINFDEVIKNTPFVSVTNKVEFLKSNNYVEEEDEQFKYLLKIKEYKISDQISPLEFVRNDIEQIILNKRTVALANELEENVFKKATKSEKYEIYAQ
jgi:hypothetical protein